MRFLRFKEIFFKIINILSKLVPNNINFIILRGPLKGFRWISGAAAGPGKGLSPILNLTESTQINLAKEASSKNGISFDIGANVGLYTLLFSRYTKEVYAFEPLSRNIRFLEKHLKINNLENAKLIKSAVSDLNGIFLFKEGNNYALGKLDNRGSIPVSVISLDKFIYNKKIYPDILKIDVEGSELSVLKGAYQYLNSAHPIILLSTHSDLIKEECLKYLLNLNYLKIVPVNAKRIKNADQFIIKKGK